MRQSFCFCDSERGENYFIFRRREIECAGVVLPFDFWIWPGDTFKLQVWVP